MTGRRNTRSFWDEKDYGFWDRPALGIDSEPIPWATRCFLRPLLPALKGKVVLDLGCGPGLLTPYLAAAADRVVAIDFSATAIAAARARCASIANVSFFVGDALEWTHDGKFDVITGRMFLHEVMHEDTPRFLDRLDALLASGGFLYFHENSYYNPIARFIRRRLVGKYGIPKHGSENELPFDAARFALYAQRFRYCERFVDGVELAQKLYEYLSPVKADGLGKVFVAADRQLTSFHARTGLLDNWSYTQTVYASRTAPRSEILGVERSDGS